MDTVHKLQNAVKTQASDMRDELQALAKWEQDMLKRNTRTCRVEEKYCPVRGSDETDQREAEKDAGQRAKEEGNEHFRNGKFEEAICSYSVGIDKDRFGAATHLLFSNRAMCWLKLGEWDKAEDDASSSIDLLRTYYKAYYRRALARRKKGLFKEARGDLETVLAFAPNDKDTINELKEVTSLLRSEETKKTASVAPKRKKLVIEEVEDESDDAPEATPKIPEVKAAPVSLNVKRNPRVEELPDESEPKVVPPPSKKADPLPKASSEPEPKVVPPPSKKADPLPKASSEPEPKVVPPPSKKAEPLPKASSKSPEKSERLPSAPRKVNLREPQTFSELERTFQEIGDDNVSVLKYVKMISPKKFPILVGVSLTPELFCGVIRSSLEMEAVEAHSWMQSLASVKRVDELFMLLSDDEETLLNIGISHARQSGLDMAAIEATFS